MGTHAMEALLGVIIIFSSISFLFSHQTPEDFSGIGKLAYDCISYLDESGGLREAAMNSDIAPISRKMAGCLPASLESHVMLCSASCTPPVEKKANVVNARYILYGNGVAFNPSEVIVSVWRK
ncbi:MAG: hypothetical protein HZB68_05565 [Candidatus Aenigmarchaeota archaeon]|nr:hypothetical protein [Candidatus Aenigmarchaeota archaeon]